MSDKPRNLSKKQQENINQQLAPVYAKVGVLTFSVGLVAILVGLWIDRANGTTPIFTLVLLVVSVPLVLWQNTRMLRKAVAKLAAETKNNPKTETGK